MPPQSSAVLTGLASGYEPMARGIPFQRTFPLQGLPFVGGGGGMLGSAVGMAATPFVQQMMGQAGMVPMGVGHDQNVYDLLMNQRYTQMQMQAMRQAADSDRQAIFQTFRGLAAVTGTPFGAELRRATNALTSTAVMAAPMFAEMMPEFMDQLGGARGSATVMALRMMQAGRYRTDPVTGRMGMSPESAGGMANRLMEDLYAPEAIGRMQGLRAGQVGGLFQELQARGMLGTGAAATPGGTGALGNDVRSQVIRALQDLNMDRPGDLRQSAGRLGVDLSRGPQGLSGTDLDKLQADPMVSDRLRAFDTERVKRSLKAYTGAVAAMRDIFGDLGRPNAPMQELVSGLEALTMGSMSQIDPARLGIMARQTANLARQTGVGLDNALMLQQHAAARAQQMGIEPVFAVQATQGALGFGGAYRAQGHAAHTAWGAMNADQVQQLDTNLRVQAASSDMANRMAVALRTGETIGGFRAGSQAGRYVAAVRAGLNQFQDEGGQLRSVNMSDAEFLHMMTTAQDTRGRPANVGEGDVRTMLGEAGTNREFVERHRLTDIVRRAQGPDDVHPFVAHRLQETLYSRLRDQMVRQGVADPEASRRAQGLAVDASRRATERMFQLSTEEFSDTGTRNRLMGDILRDELRQSGVLRDMDPTDRQQWLRQTAEQFYGHANTALAASRYSAFGNLQNVHRLTNQTTLNEADRQQMQARFTGEMQEAMAPLGRGTILSRAVDALQNVRSDDPQAMLKVLGQALGGVRTDDINRALMPAFRKVLDRREMVEALQRRVQAEQNPEERVGLMQQLETSRRELTYQATMLAQTGEQFGMFSADSLGHEDIARAARSTAGLMTARNDIVGLRGAFGGQVTDTEVTNILAPAMTREAAITALGFTGAYADLNPDRQRQVDRLAQRGRAGTEANYVEAVAVLSARRGMDVDLLQQYSAAEDEVARLEHIPEAKRNDRQRKQLEVATAARNARHEEMRLGGQQAILDETVKKVKDQFRAPTRAPGQPEAPSQIGDPDARRMAVAYLAANVENVADDDVRTQMGGLTFSEGEAGKAEARALARVNRRAIPYRATADEVKHIQSQYRGQITEDEAKELANARLRAMRLGIDEEEVANIQKEDGVPADQRNPQTEMDAIDKAFARRADARWKVSDQDREEWRKDHPRPTPTPKERARFLDVWPELKPKNLTETQIDDEMERRAILLGRQDANRRDFAQFWASEEGQAFRETTDYAQQDVENVAMRLVQTPQMVQRLGSRAIEMHEQLQRGQQRLRELALYHAGGDLARLAAGNLDVNVTTPEGAAVADRVREEWNTTVRGQRDILRELHEQEGQRGHRFQLGDETEARRAVRDREISRRIAAEPKATKDRQKEIKDEEEKRFLTSQLSPVQRDFVARRAIELGTEERARRMLQLPLGAELSEFDQARVAGIRWGAGNEDEARLLYGDDRWNDLKPDQQQAVLRQMREGTKGNQQKALNILDLRPGQLGTGDNRARVEAVMAGLQKDAHQRQLAGVAEDLDVDSLEEDEKKRVQAAIKAARLGIASQDWARDQAGLEPNPLSSQQQADVQTEREQRGNRLEALRQLNLGAGMRALTGPERERIAAVQGGGMTRAAAIKTLGIKETDYNKLSADDQRRVDRAVRGLGAESRERAIKALGLKERDYGKLSAADRRRVDEAAKGPEPDSAQARAMTLLGIDRGQVMTDEQAKNLKQLTYDIGVTRRVSPEQERQITEYQETESRLKAMAERQGSSYDAMKRALVDNRKVAGERLKFLPAEEQATGKAREVIERGTKKRDQAAADLSGVVDELGKIDKSLADEDLPKAERDRLTARRDTLRDRRQRLVGDVNAYEQQVTDAHTGLAEHGRRLGVSTTEMVAGRRSQGGLTEMTDPAERERWAAARRDYDVAQGVIGSSAGRIDYLQGQLRGHEHAGDEFFGTNATTDPVKIRRRNMRAELEMRRGEVAKATVMRQEALARIHDDAVRRGVTEQERLRGRGELQEGARTAFQQLAGQYEKQAGVVGGIASALGLPGGLASLAGATAPLRRLAAMQAEAQRREQEDPRNLAKSVLSEYGFQQGDKPSETVSTLAGMMEGTLGRGMARRALETAQTLKQRAKTGGQSADLPGVDKMADEYFDTKQMKPKDKETDEQFRARRRQSVLDFQKKYGFETSHGELTDTGRGQFTQFEQAVQFQQQTGLLTFGHDHSGHRRRNQESMLGGLFHQMLHGGPSLRPGPGQQGQEGGTQRIEGVLKVELEGMHGTGALTASYGRNDVAPVGR